MDLPVLAEENVCDRQLTSSCCTRKTIYYQSVTTMTDVRRYVITSRGVSGLTSAGWHVSTYWLNGISHELFASSSASVHWRLMRKPRWRLLSSNMDNYNIPTSLVTVWLMLTNNPLIFAIFNTRYMVVFALALVSQTGFTFRVVYLWLYTFNYVLPNFICYIKH